MASLINPFDCYVLPGFYGRAEPPSVRDFISRILNADTFVAAQAAIRSLEDEARQLREDGSDYVKHLRYNAEQIKRVVNACRDSRYYL